MFFYRCLETEVRESIGSRTSTLSSFKELGPPDLVHLSKIYPNKAVKESGTYHFVTGVDASSLASLAAYLNTLTFVLGEDEVWFGKHPLWKVHSGIYCCYNAFSRIDTRVMVKIPGSVEAYVVDSRGDRRPAASDKLWTETYMSAMLRALLLVDDDLYYVNCCRKLDPLQNLENAARFLDAFTELFFQGPSLGCVAEAQVPTLVSNYLVDGFLKFLEITGLYKEGIEALEPLIEKDSEVLYLKARVLLMSNQETKAVRLLNQAILQSPRNAYLLELQAEFCEKKGRLDLAMDCAIRALDAAPSEFFTWARLVSVYTKKKDYAKALLTLNSCPMFTHHPLDAHRMRQPAKVHLPLPQDGKIESLWAIDLTEEVDVADPQLLKLPAPTLRATFAKAYDMLTDIVKQIGWDALLKCRSEVFLMEEEYNKEVKEAKEKQSSIQESTDEMQNGVAKPSIAANEPETNTSNTNGQVIANVEAETEKIKNKRLCERWLDNLFMVLYEDVRVYTVWRAEMIHYQSQQLVYEKSALEWEILGLVAHRLKHEDEAIDAFVRSIRIKFSHRVMWQLLDYYMKRITTSPSDANAALDAVVQLSAWNHRWYADFSPKLFESLKKLIEVEGRVKVQSSIEAKYSPQGVVGLISEQLKTLTEFGGEGMES